MPKLAPGQISYARIQQWLREHKITPQAAEDMIRSGAAAGPPSDRRAELLPETAQQFYKALQAQIADANAALTEVGDPTQFHLTVVDTSKPRKAPERKAKPRSKKGGA